MSEDKHWEKQCSYILNINTTQVGHVLLLMILSVMAVAEDPLVFTSRLMW